MKYTLQSKFLPAVAPYLVDGTLPPQNYSATIKLLHTEAIATAIASSDPNDILQSLPPPIADEETLLPRPYRTTVQ